MPRQSVRSVNRHFIVVLFFLFANACPRCLHPLFTATVGRLIYRCMKRTAAVVRQNLATITGLPADHPEVRRLAVSTFCHYGHYLFDYMLMYRINKENKDRFVSAEPGREKIPACLADGKGVLLVTPHLGNWELGGIVLSWLGCGISVLTYREEDEALNRMRERFRARRGIKSIYIDPQQDSLRSAVETIQALRRNEVVALLADRDSPTENVEVRFFGRKVRLPAGIGYLALLSGAPLVPVFVVLERDRRYVGLVEDPIRIVAGEGDRAAAVQEGMQQLAAVFERYVARHPDQWYNFYPYWG